MNKEDKEFVEKIEVAFLVTTPTGPTDCIDLEKQRLCKIIRKQEEGRELLHLEINKLRELLAWAGCGLEHIQSDEDKRQAEHLRSTIVDYLSITA